MLTILLVAQDTPMPEMGFELGLGLDRSLRPLQRMVPAAQIYVDLGLDPYLPNFAERLSVEMYRAVHIHFDLSEMVMLNTPDGVLCGPAELNAPGSTNWESRTIWDTPILREKTAFYRDGRILSIDEVARLP